MGTPDENSGKPMQRRPFKIHFEYFFENGTSAEVQDYLVTKLMPTTAAVLKQFIQVCARGSFDQRACRRFALGTNSHQIISADQKTGP
jgi:hypothetical protein